MRADAVWNAGALVQIPLPPLILSAEPVEVSKDGEGLGVGERGERPSVNARAVPPPPNPSPPGRGAGTFLLRACRRRWHGSLGHRRTGNGNADNLGIGRAGNRDDRGRAFGRDRDHRRGGVGGGISGFLLAPGEREQRAAKSSDCYSGTHGIPLKGGARAATCETLGWGKGSRWGWWTLQITGECCQVITSRLECSLM